jgi:hypothetical protein
MKRIGFLNLVFLLLFLLSSTAFPVLIRGASSISYAEDLKVSESDKSNSHLKPEIITLTTEQRIARSGCCSWHGGVCDCIGGRVVCCDGTFSPTCTCHHESNKDVMDPKE